MKGKNINITEEELKIKLKPLFVKEEFIAQQQLLKRLADDLQVSVLDCATALSLLNQPQIDCNNEVEGIKQPVHSLSKQKFVRYRLDIGKKHLVSIEEIKAVLIEVSGVDKNRIGRLDVRNYYSLVDLPDGMPADIFQLLTEVDLNQRKLNIKRVKYQPRFYRRNIKK